MVNLENETSQDLIVRGQMDVGDKNNIGVLMTHRTASDYENQLIAIDGKYYFTPKDILRYQLMRSSSDNPESIRFENTYDENDVLIDSEEILSLNQSDSSYTLSYVHNEEDYSLSASYNDFGKDFRADMGFVSMVDFKKLVFGGDYFWRGDKESKWTRWGFFGDWDKTEDQAGLKLEEEFELHFNLQGPMQFNTNFGVVDREKYFNEEYFDETFFMMWFQFKPMSSLTLGNFIQLGDQIDYANTQLGKITLFEPFVEWQIGKHFNINLNHTKQILKVDGGELFDASLTDLRFAYQFNTRSRLSLTLQSTNVDRNLDLFLANQDQDPENDYQARSKSFGTQLIYSYKINPQSLMYLGYSDNAMNSQQTNSLQKFDKTLFAKFSYMWQH